MFVRFTRIAALVLILSGLLGTVVASALPPDFPKGALRDEIQAVVSRIAIGLPLGFYPPFAADPVELGPGVQVFVTQQQFRPPDALAALERGFPIARFSSEEDIQLPTSTIPAGNYYLVLWIADLPFERFEVQFLPRTPLLLYVTQQGFELVDFAIPCRVQVEVPNPNPDKIFPFTVSSVTTEACNPSASSAEAVASAVSSPKPNAANEKASGWHEFSIGGLGTLGYGSPILPMAQYKNIVKPRQLVFPTKEELFPKPPQEPPPPS